eukprot:NODE_384_length_8342_cov_0.411379.p2 type:complete len:272 gc:universal NODE_384_length_8342_cov_0.411379:5672-6487(+)
MDQVNTFMDGLSPAIQQLANITAATSMATAVDQAQRAETSVKMVLKDHTDRDRHRRTKFTRRNCNYCKKTGHTIDKCFKKHPELRNQSPRVQSQNNNSGNNYGNDNNRQNQPPEVTVQKNGQNGSVLWNSGATDSFINKEYDKQESFCSGFNGHKVQIEGKIHIKFKLPNDNPSSTYSHQFWIAAGIVYNFIFGIDLITELNILLDAANCTIVIGPNSYLYGVPILQSIAQIDPFESLKHKYKAIFGSKPGIVPNFLYKIPFKTIPDAFRM